MDNAEDIFTSRSLVIGCVGPWVTMRMAYALQIMPCAFSICPACQWVTPALMIAIPSFALFGLYSFLFWGHKNVQRLENISPHTVLVFIMDSHLTFKSLSLHVSIHHFACIQSCLLKELQVGKDLTECTPHH